MKWYGFLLGLVVCFSGIADPAFIDFDLNLIYPETLGGMSCNRVEKYNEQDLGYTLFFNHKTAFQIELSVLDLGESAIADGVLPETLAPLFECVDTLHALASKHGKMARITKQSQSFIPAKGDVQFANRTYYFYQPETNSVGAVKPIARAEAVYALGAKNKFFRIHFKYDRVQGRTAKKVEALIIKEMLALLNQKPSNKEILLGACALFDKDPTSTAGSLAAAKINNTGAECGVDFNIYDEFFFWPKNYSMPENADLLEVGYFAGMLKHCLANNLSTGGEVEAFTSMVNTYSTLRKNGKIESMPKLDEWKSETDKATLYIKLLKEFGYQVPRS